jgi:hypothetical protein
MKTTNGLPLVLIFLLTGLVLLVAAYAADKRSASLEASAGKLIMLATESSIKPDALRITSVRQSERGIEISFTTLPDRIYAVQRSKEFPVGPWQVIGEVAGTGNTLHVLDADLPSTGNRFYRVTEAKDAAIELDGERAASLKPSAISTEPSNQIFLEAEFGVLVPPMAMLKDSQAFAGRYIQTSVVDGGSASYSITIPQTGDYVIWCRVLAPDSHHDSFNVSVDGGTGDIFDVAEREWSNAWQWTPVNGRGGAGGAPLTIDPRIFTLSDGVHQLLFRGREITCLDRLIITDDLTFVPSNEPPPPPPLDVLASPGDQQVELNWGASLGAIGYNVKRSLTPGGPYIAIANKVLPTSYTDTGLNNCTTYYYVVSAKSLIGESADSLEASATPLCPPICIDLEAESGQLVAPMAVLPDSRASAGKYIQSSTVNSGSASYSFTINQSGSFVIWCRVLAPDFRHDSFYVSVDGGPEDIYDVAEGTWSPEWQWTQVNGRGRNERNPPLTINPRVFNLAAGTHTLRFRGRESTCLDRLLITNDPRCVPLAPPSNLTATQTTQSAIDLAWIDNSANETGFKIERKIGANGAYSQIAAVGANTTAFADATISSGVQYFYHVRATYSVGDSTYSNEATNDSDSDGLPDGWELQFFGNLQQTPLGDPDGDGVTNLTEFLQGRNPTKGAVADSNNVVQLKVFTPLE